MKQFRLFISLKVLLLALLMAISLNGFSQTREVSGLVTDDTSAPIPGVAVVVKGTSLGVVTDVNGKYSIKVPTATKMLEFSFLGMETLQMPLGAGNIVNASMKSDNVAIDEVVVVGYGTQKKANLTGSVDMVTSKSLENRPITNVSEGLQGLIPNLNVTVFNGDPTTSTDLNIRGFESINGGSPLVLVDGVPMDMDRLNPGDIESITVLKDAAAGAIYGARAAFGVILVETKKGTGSDGKINIRYSGEFSAVKPIFNVDPVENGYEYAILRNKAATRNGESAAYADDYMARLKKYWDNPTTEKGWGVIDGMFENYEFPNLSNELMGSFAPKQKHDLSISSSNNRSSIYSSFGFLDTRGPLNSSANDRFNRYNILLKADYKINKWITINQQITYNISKSDKPTGNGKGSNTAGSYLNNLIRLEPTRAHVVPYIEEYPELEGQYWEHGLTVLPDLLLGGRTTYTDQDAWFKSGISLNPIKGLRIVSDISYQMYNRQYEKVSLPYRTVNQNLSNPDHFTTKGENLIDVRRDFNQYYVYNAYAEYTLDQFKDHYLKAMIGFNQEWGRNNFIDGDARQLASTGIPDIGATTGTQTISGGKNHVALRGAFYRVNYIFKDKYLFEFNGRYDGTSKFPKDSRFGFFPSGSLAWRISNENFMDWSKKLFDDIKFRASYGELGNQLVGSNYPYIASMNVTSSLFPLGETVIPMIGIPGLISPTLTWEKVVTQNIGVDLSLFKNRLNVSYDYYIRDTKDMLMRRGYPSILGATAPNENAADLRTQGWELSVKWRQAISTDLSYDIALSLADSKSKITKYENPTGTLSTYYEGQNIGEIWGYQTDGFIQNADELAKLPDQSFIGNGWKIGDIRFKDLDGSKRIDNGNNTLADHGDMVVIGNETPRYTFGINANIIYKSFSLAAFFQGVGKRDYYPSTDAWTWFFPWRSYMADKSWEPNSWSPTNPNAYWPVASTGDKNFASQTKYLQNASYIRLKSLTVSYNLPNKWMNKIKLNNVKIYLSGQNLGVFSKIRKPLDPEYVYSKYLDYPLAKTYSIGIIINM